MSTVVYSLYTRSSVIKINDVNVNEGCISVPRFVCLRMEANSAEKEKCSYI
jgi:hypothetical protein